jgi:uncharacterized OsmC-like protein
MKTQLLAITNGVDVNKLEQTVQAVKDAPEIASFKFRVQNNWIDGGQNCSRVQQFSMGGQEIQHKEDFNLVADEHEVLLGKDAGANPVEYLLHALASCVTSSMVYHGAARGMEVEAVESSLEGTLDLRGFLGIAPNVRNGYQQIRLKLRIKTNVNDEQFRVLASLGPKYSPVYDSLSKGVPIAVSAERMS